MPWNLSFSAVIRHPHSEPQDSEVRVGPRQGPGNTTPTYAGLIPAAAITVAAITVGTVRSRENPRLRPSRALPPVGLFAVGPDVLSRFLASVTSEPNQSSQTSPPTAFPKADKMSTVRKTPEVPPRFLPHDRNSRNSPPPRGAEVSG